MELRKRVQSTKFWTTVAVLGGLWWGVRWWLIKLVDLRTSEKLGEAVFENLAGLTMTTAAWITVFTVALWFGVNLGQKIAFLKNGGGD